MRRGHGIQVRLPLADLVPFVVSEEEGLVPHDRAAHRAAKLVQTERGNGPVAPVEEIPRVQGVVSQKLINISVQLIAAAPNYDVDRASRILAELRFLVAGLHLELLNRIHRRIENDAADGAFGVVDTVYRIVVAAGPLAVDLYSGLTRPRSEILIVVRVPHGRGWRHANGQN